MVGNNTHGNILLLIGPIGCASHPSDNLDNWLENICIIV
ncbi:hypothetical protein EVA_16441 [gut metagenome]|uniref:Uncharacterized protein n=1 Tax=gut metagenome TaxID=749906 RepID=J9FLZ5_9ZZZZ